MQGRLTLRSFAAIAGMLLAWQVPAARAATITVTSTADSGAGSLRAAVAAASPGDTVLVPAAGTLAPGNGPRYVVSSGPIPVSKPITIQGAGAPVTIIDGQGNSTVFQVSGGGTVTFGGLTITGGTSTSAPGGGGVQAIGTNLAFTNVVVSGNSVSITSNTGSLGGGGIYDAGGSLNLAGSTVANNTVAVTGTGSDDGGGGIWANGTTTISSSTISDNTAAVLTTTAGAAPGGGGLLIGPGAAKTSISGSTLSANTAISTAPSASDAGGGAIDNQSGTLSISTSTIDHNTADVAATALSGGGGILDAGGGGNPVYLNSTIADNQTDVPASSSDGGGGLLSLGVGTLTMTNTTIADNGATAAVGGGIADAGSTIKLKSTIVAQNGAGAGGANCAGGLGGQTTSFASQGYNLATDGSCQLGTATDIVTTTPGLGPLADNGGPAQTISLLPGSPATDAIPAASCTDQSGKAVNVDERGITRPQPVVVGNCDIGAYELLETGALLALTANPSESAIVLGAPTSVSFSIVNAGPDPATSTTLTLNLSSGLQALSVLPSQGSCQQSGAAITCALGTIATTGTAKVTVNVRATAFGTYTLAGATSAAQANALPTAASTTVTLLAPVPVPTLTAVSESNKRWRHGNRLPKLARHARTPTGTTFAFTLNAPSTVTFSFTGTVAGVRAGHRCIPKGTGRARGRPCKLPAAPQTLTLNAPAGADQLAFEGRLSRTARLAPGDYRVTILATDSAGRSKPATLRFTII